MCIYWTTGRDLNAKTDLHQIGNKLHQASSFNRSTGDVHLLDQRERSSLQRLEIIRLVSSSCWKIFAFLHFQIFQRTHVRTVLQTLGLLSRRRPVQSWSVPREAGSGVTSTPMKAQKLLLRGQAMKRWKQSSSRGQKGHCPSLWILQRRSRDRVLNLFLCSNQIKNLHFWGT